MNEVWKPVVGFEGLYEVSDHGRVRSLDREVWRLSRAGRRYVWLRPGQVMKPYRQPDGKPWKRYWQIRLRDRVGVDHHKHVHQLVAEAFYGPCPPGQQVRHGPGGMLDNALANLSYGTAAENQADRVRDGTSNRGERNSSAKLTQSHAEAIRRSGRKQRELAEEFGVSKATISMIVNGQRWQED
jgi:predicted XRE-type DNA-binding protein